MPKATVSTQTERFELETLPEGFVLLKRLTYGQFLQRRDMATEMAVMADEKQEGKNRMQLQTMQQLVAAFEFKNCIVDHNLEGDDDQKLDFSKDAVLTVLDPRIGQEISGLIDKMNQFEETAKN